MLREIRTLEIDQWMSEKEEPWRTLRASAGLLVDLHIPAMTAQSAKGELLIAASGDWISKEAGLIRGE